MEYVGNSVMAAYLDWGGKKIAACTPSGTQADKASAIFHTWFARLPWILASVWQLGQERGSGMARIHGVQQHAFCSLSIVKN